MTPIGYRLARLDRLIDQAMRRGDDATVRELRCERADLRLMMTMEGMAAMLRVSA